MRIDLLLYKEKLDQYVTMWTKIETRGYRLWKILGLREDVLYQHLSLLIWKQIFFLKMSVISVIVDTFYNQIAKSAATLYTLKILLELNTVFCINLLVLVFSKFAHTNCNVICFSFQVQGLWTPKPLPHCLSIVRINKCPKLIYNEMTWNILSLQED